MRTFYASLFVMLFALTASAQTKSAYSLYVENRTPCTQYYVVFGDEVCECGTSYSSIILTIAPYSATTYTNSTLIPGYPTSAPKGIVGAKILDGPTSCNTNAGVVGEVNCGFPAVYGYMAISANCSPCARTIATWYPPMQSCRDMARLIFTP